jgi:hypothetical protein
VDDFELTPGSEYRVASLRTREEALTTEGTFRGITSMGSVDALVLEVDGDTRLVPTHMVTSVDVLEAAGREDTGEDSGSYYV